MTEVSRVSRRAGMSYSPAERQANPGWRPLGAQNLVADLSNSVLRNACPLFDPSLFLSSCYFVCIHPVVACTILTFPGMTVWTTGFSAYGQRFSALPTRPGSAASSPPKG